MFDLGIAPAVLVFVGGGLYTLGALVLRAAPPESRARDLRLPRDLPRARDLRRRGPLRRDRGLRRCRWLNRGATGGSLRYSHEHEDTEVRRRVARRAHPGAVRGAPAQGHRARFHRQVQRHQGSRHLPLCRLRCRALPLRGEVRFRLRLAELRRACEPGERRHRDGHELRDDPHRGQLRRRAAATSATSSRTAPARPGSATASTPARSTWRSHERAERDRHVRGRLLLGRRGRLPEHARRHRRPGRLHRAATPTARATSRSAAALPATPRRSRSPSIRPRSRTASSSTASGACTTRPRSTARAGTSAPSTARRSSPTRPEQAEVATESKARAQTQFGKPIATEIEPASTFWPAEEYHQQYLVKNGRATCRI